MENNNKIKTPTNTAAMAPKQQTAVAKKGNATVVDFLQSPKFKEQLMAALPKFFDGDRFVRSALTEFRLNPALKECSVPSVLGYFMQAAALGLEPASTLGQCYPVPFNNKRTGQREVQFITGYRGMLSIARRSGDIASVDAQIVYKNDEIDLEYGLESKLVHKPVLDGDRGPMIGAYCVVKFKDGSYQTKFMSKEEIDAHRKRSKAGSYGPWVTDYEEMAKKTVFRAVFKWLPIAVETAGTINATDENVVNYKSTATNDDDLLEIEFVAAEDTGYDNAPAETT